MFLERRNAVSGRWQLYTSQQDHHADCVRYPFDQIPSRVFLDTSVINLIVKNSSAIFEGEEISPDTPTNQGREVEALLHLFAVGAHAQWALFASETSIAEVSRTPCDETRNALQSYVYELVERLPPHLGREHGDSCETDLSGALDALPDEGDRQLISHAIALSCDAFVTTDIRTIISKRDQLPSIPLRLLTPCEWWAHVKPWGRLWL